MHNQNLVAIEGSMVDNMFVSEVALDLWHTMGGSLSQCMYKLCGLTREGTEAMKLHTTNVNETIE